jgi:hypothetical protein
VCSVFVALDSVPSRECLAFAPGSHRWREAQPRDFSRGVPYAAPPDTPISCMVPLDDCAVRDAEHSWLRCAASSSP